MRTLLGTLSALVLLLAGCGDEGSDASDPSSAEAELLALVSQSDVGGEIASEAVPVEELETSFSDDRMPTAIDRALDSAELPEGTVPLGTVVAVGCEAPAEDDVQVEVTDDRVEVTAPPVTTDKQCLVPVTTVALVASPSASRTARRGRRPPTAGCRRTAR